jgi:AcrR family transcriptional regulator
MPSQEPSGPTRQSPPSTGSPGDARRDRWNEHRTTRRGELVDAAIRAIVKHGARVGMDEIAAEAGITKPVLYRHFTDKADLYLAVADRATQTLIAAMIPATTGASVTASPRERVRGLVDAYLETIEVNPQLYRFMVSRSFVQIDTDPIFANESIIATTLCGLFERWMSEGGMNTGAAEPFSYAVVGGVRTAGAWWLDNQSMPREELSDHLTDMVWYTVEGITRAHGHRSAPNTPAEPLHPDAGDLTADNRPALRPPE